MHELLANGLRDLGHEVTDHPNITLEQLPQALQAAEVIVIRSKFIISKEIIDMGPHLKLIARAGAGIDNVDEDYARKKNIQCIHAAGANADAVGEHALGMLLMLFNKLKQADSQVRQGVWNREANRGMELKGKSIGIIGYGHTGAAVAQKLSGLGVHIYAYDKYKKGFGNHLVQESNMETIFEKADIVTMHIPLTHETKYLCNKNWIYNFKKKIYVMNLCRGGVINTSELADALLEGKVLGCMLDVLENEKLSSFNSKEDAWLKVLKEHPNVLLSPHIAGWTNESYERISAYLLQSISLFKE